MTIIPWIPYLYHPLVFGAFALLLLYATTKFVKQRKLKGYVTFAAISVFALSVFASLYVELQRERQISVESPSAARPGQTQVNVGVGGTINNNYGVGTQINNVKGTHEKPPR